MAIEIDINNIKKINYGVMNNYIDVTEIIKNKFETDDTIILSNDIFPTDPYFGKVKRIVFYYRNGTNTIVNENDTIKKKVYIENTIQPMINFDYDNKYISNEINFNYILSTNVRDENNIIEWIIYHFLIGFDYIVIIDHKSKTPVSQLIQQYKWKHKVHVIRREDDNAVKMTFLNDIIVPFMMAKCKKYFIHLDADEYIYINKQYTLDSFLNKINGDIIMVNWLMFGNNNVKSNNHSYKCLIPTFTKSANKLDQHFKCFIKVDKNHPFMFNNPHSIKYKTKKQNIYTNVFGNIFNESNVHKLMEKVPNVAIESVPMYINHYFVQSREDYMKRKVNRNRDDIATNRPFDENIFNIYNDITNTNLLSYNEMIINNIEDTNTFGFIMIRYVKCSETNKAWIRCYESIRRFYNNKIVIIDDNSDMKFITNINTVNCTVINSDFPRRGELLPYYYMITKKLFSRAVVIHDSMEIVNHFDFMNIPNYKNYSRLFSFNNSSYNLDIEYFQPMCNYLKNGEMLYNYHITNIKNMIGCFGVCYVIDNDFLINVDKRFNIVNLVNYVDTRKKRMTLERLLSCLFEYVRGKSFITRPDIFGNIHANNNNYIVKHYFGR